MPSVVSGIQILPVLQMISILNKFGSYRDNLFNWYLSSSAATTPINKNQAAVNLNNNKLLYSTVISHGVGCTGESNCSSSCPSSSNSSVSNLSFGSSLLPLPALLPLPPMLTQISPTSIACKRNPARYKTEMCRPFQASLINSRCRNQTLANRGTVSIFEAQDKY